ncbi:T9SS type A sorting domain-containing protein [bacterium]|nr:T9SS type A sorting domain-containing protein [bacterium]
MRRDVLSRIPLQFIENGGQWDAPVEFGVIRGMEKAAFSREGVTIFRPQRRSVALPSYSEGGMSNGMDAEIWGKVERLGLHFIRPSVKLRVTGSGLTDTKTNFYIGSDSSRWSAGLDSFTGVRYADVWEGIDVSFTEKGGKLVQRIDIGAGEDLASVAFSASGFAHGEALQSARWFDDNGHAVPAGGGFEQYGDTIRLRPYRNFLERRMVIETEFNTLLGGSGIEELHGYDIDEKGRIVVAMLTTSTDLPVINASQEMHRGGSLPLETDYYIASFDAEMQICNWSTYLGGSEDEAFHAYVDLLHGDLRGCITPHLEKLETSGSNTYMLGTTESYDFPISSNAMQKNRQPPTMGETTATTLTMFDDTGQLVQSTWVGGPAMFSPFSLDASSQGDVLVGGITSGEQWFVQPGALLDSNTVDQPYVDSIMTILSFVKFTKDLDSVQAGTYLFPFPGVKTAGTSGLMTEITEQGELVIAIQLVDSTTHPPAIASWQSSGGKEDLLVCKVNASFTDYVFTTWLGGKVIAGSDLAVTKDGDVIVAGIDFTGDLVMRHPLSSTYSTAKGVQSHFVAKIPGRGGVADFVTYLPWLEKSANLSFGSSVDVLDCGDILVFGIGITDSILFQNPDDTVSSVFQNGQTPYLLALDPTGQNIRYSSYWHFDGSYPNQQTLGFGVSGGRLVSAPGSPTSLHTEVHNGQLYLGGYIPSIYKDSLTTFHEFQPLYGGGEQDVALIRTRAPGCALLACSVEMEDTVRISRTPPWISPERLLVDVEVANVDPVRSAGEVECVLTLPPGLVLDPSTQSLRQTLSGTIAPGRTEHFTWTLRVDTSALVLAADSGLWIDAVTYYKVGDNPREGAPAALPCEHYLRFEQVEHLEPLLACNVEMPDSILVNGTGDNYFPQPFTVRFTTENTGTEAVTFARFGLYPGGDIGAIPVPANQKYQPGVTLPPGETHALTWQVRTERRAEDRWMRVLVAGEDAIGNPITFCEQEVFVPGLLSPRCQPASTVEIRVDPSTGAYTPDPFEVGMTMQQVLDTTLLDCVGVIDLSACRYVGLASGETLQRPAVRLSADESDTLRWQLSLSSIPSVTAYDTVVYQTYSAGELRSSCLQVFRIVTLSENVSCAITAGDSLTQQDLLSRTPVPLSGILRNIGTVPVSVDHLRLSIPAGSGVYADEALMQTGRTLGPNEDLVIDWTLHARILRNSRDVLLEVSAFDDTDSLLTSCMHNLHIAGGPELQCMLSAADTVRFDRQGPAYDPDPCPVTVDLRNLLDEEERSVDAHIDLSSATRFTLASGETTEKTITVIDSQATGTVTWLLIPQPASTAEDQEVIVRYRSDEQTEWKECSVIIHIEAWPEETGTDCATGGHDSLYADPYYERFIPDPLFVSYTVTNTGTIALTGCEASIILPPEFVLAGSDSTQLFTSPEFANQQGGPVSPGTLLPNASCTRWWMITPSNQLTAAGPVNVTWQWRSDQQGSSDGCSSSIEVVFDSPGSVVLSPKHLYFEAERGGPLPAAQSVQLWTGGGLSMPWSMQPTETWLNANPLSGSQEATVVVQPNSTMLDVGGHGAALNVSATPSNRSIAVTYVIRKSTGVDDPSLPAALTLEAWPQPVAIGGMLQVAIPGAGDESYRLSLYDMLGRERLSRTLEAGGQWGIAVSGTQFTPGSYILRVTAADGAQVSKLISVIR